ncbi:head maturation protease, ClpP-related, partial [Amycolatopsis sp. NPDC051128]|uniref:head maturation protease, ClpP-related n=1 Tax=Amycolatopsis sp. NPDC051128 TaxID=3155412 RepID=UPI00342D9AB0
MTRTRYQLSAAVMEQVTAALASRARRADAEDDGFEEDATVETAENGDELELILSGRIGASFWFGGVSAAMVAEAIAGHTGDLRLRINSPGGDAFEGFAIYNLLSRHPGQITVTVDGLAASAASIISMVGDTIEMSPASQLMIHDAWTVAIGNADDLRAEADVIDSISQIGAELYADKAGGTAEAWRGKMRAESWYAPSEAVAAGLADVALPGRHGNAAAPSEQDLEERAARGEFRYAGRAKAPAPVINRAAARPVVTAGRKHGRKVTAASVGGRAGALVSRGALAYRAQPGLLQRAMVSLESEIRGNTFEGYAAVFGQVSDKTGENWREQFAEGSFDDVIAEQLTAALWNHNPDHLLGRQSSGTLRLSADSGGLSYELDIPNTSVGRDLRELHERGDITGASVGFLPGLDTWGLTEQGDRLRTHTQVSYLRDISPVSFAAYDGTSVDMRSA